MQRDPITTIRSRTVTIREPNIDTDQIIPARFLTVTDRSGLGAACFQDWRFDGAGQPVDHVLNRIDPAEQAILVTGDNFGCGSSREHAPWALQDFGLKAVITSSAADIFKANAAKNGLVVCEIDAQSHQALMDRDGGEAEIDLEHCTVTAGNIRASFRLEPFARTCLMQGVDELGYILQQTEAIQRFERAQGL